MRYVGEPVAVVFAADAYVAEDAADLVFVDIDELPPHPRRRRPRRPMFDEGHDHRSRGDRQGLWRRRCGLSPRPHTVVELTLAIGRHSGVPLETRGAIARYDARADVLELHGAAKVPHRNRERWRACSACRRDNVQLYEGHVGGGFGIRGEIYPGGCAGLRSPRCDSAGR